MGNDAESADGVLLLDKPSGPTSHDMVDALRRRLGLKKAGHAGTLDPMASGLLVIMVGRGTKLAPFLPGDPKVYEGSMLLGLTTDTLDIEGKVTADNGYRGGEKEVRAALASLVGESEQAPPMYSAVKYRGKALYRYARGGEEVPRKPRKVRVYNAAITAFREMGERAEADFVIACSPGAYVRAFAESVGQALGCGATLSRLRRASSGPFRVEDALELEELVSRWRQGRPPLISPREAVAGMKHAVVREGRVEAARNGAALTAEMLEEGGEGLREGEPLAVLDPEGALIGFHAVASVLPFATRTLRII